MTLGRLPHHGDVTPSSDGAPTMGADMVRSGEVLLFVVDAGGGHRAAARALLAAAEETGFPLRLRAVSLQEILAPQDVLKRFFGLSIEDFYNLLLRRRFTAVLEPLLRVLHRLIALRRKALVRGLVPFLRERRPAGGGLRDPELQRRDPRRPARSRSRRALPGAAHRPRRSAAALLDRARGGRGDRGHGRGGASGPRPGPARGADPPRVGHAPAPALLRLGRGRRRPGSAGPRARRARGAGRGLHRHAALRRQGLGGDRAPDAGAPPRGPRPSRHRGVRRQPPPARRASAPWAGLPGAGCMRSDSPTRSPTTWRPATCW